MGQPRRLCTEALTRIRKQFDTIHSDINNLEVELMAPIPGAEGHFIPYEHLKALRDMGQTNYASPETRTLIPLNQMLGILQQTEPKGDPRLPSTILPGSTTADIEGGVSGQAAIGSGITQSIVYNYNKGVRKPRRKG